jgi:hypothetical protein
MMKSLNVIRSLSLWGILAAIGLLLILSGCAGSPGMTSREVHRQHINTVSTNWLMLQKDIDEFLMLDRPSRLSDSISR